MNRWVAPWCARRPRGSGPLGLLVLSLAAAAPAAHAQAARADDPALAACIEAAEAGRRDEARSLAARAEAEYRAAAARDARDPEPRILLARVLVQCRVPLTGLVGQGRLVGSANALLEEALALDSTHWSARFTLAMNHFHTPAFLGRTGAAIRELETLLAQQGSRTDRPEFADTYLFLGDLYLRRGRPEDARTVWERGAALFPRHPLLGARLRGEGPATGAAGEGAAGAPPGGGTPVAALDELVVSASAVRLDAPQGGTALRRLDVLTTPGGAADLMNALQTGAGLTAAAEGADLYVRGGDPAEAPVWIDGARLFYPGRYETLNGAVFGVLDPAVLRTAFFSTGGFSVRFGNALSGVLSVETEGLPAARAGHLALNSVQAGASLQLPLGERVGAWGGVRATDGTAMLALHGRSDDYAVAPRALEAMGAAVWEPRPGSQLKLSTLVDADRSARVVDAWGVRGPFESRGGNRLLALSGRTLLGGGVAARGTVAASERSSGFLFGLLDRERVDRGIDARLDLSAPVGPAAVLRVGAEAARIDARSRGVLPVSDRFGPDAPARSADERERAEAVGGYLEAEVQPFPGLAVAAGVRGDRLPGEEEWTADPRLAAALTLGAWTLRAGGGVFHQGRWRSRYLLPDSLTPSGTPRRAAHLIAGVERAGDPSLRVEGYVKEYGRYVAAGDGPRIVGGRATGADAILRWSGRPRLNGWVTYSLLRGRVELADGATVPSAVDVTHSLTTVAKLDVTEGWQVGGTGRYATGRPFSARGGTPNGDRLPEYLRLDARLTRFGTVGGQVLVTYLEVLNLLGRGNVLGYTYDSADTLRATPAFFSEPTAVLGVSLTF